MQRENVGGATKPLAALLHASLNVLIVAGRRYLVRLQHCLLYEGIEVSADNAVPVSTPSHTQHSRVVTDRWHSTELLVLSFAIWAQIVARTLKDPDAHEPLFYVYTAVYKQFDNRLYTC